MKNQKVYFETPEGIEEVEIQHDEDWVRVSLAGEETTFAFSKTGSKVRLQSPGGQWVDVASTRVAGGAWVSLGGQTVFLPLKDRKPRKGQDEGHKGPVSPMPGTVIRVEVAAGDAVEKGTTLVVVEAMKMEHAVKASYGGTIEKVSVGVGDRVEGGTVLVIVSPNGETQEA